MNIEEQQLWDYIDGNLSGDLLNDIEYKIANDSAIKQQYEDLLRFNGTLEGIDLDEPSMSFTRNVMENLKSVPAPVVLKTKVNQNIIKAIAAFLILSVLTPLIYAISRSKFSFKELNLNFVLDKYTSPTAVNIFLGVDLILALLIIDFFMRKKIRQVKAEQE